MDDSEREENAILVGRHLNLLSGTGRELNRNQLLFADDTALLADSQERLRQPVKKFWMVCERRKSRVYVSRSKVVKCTRKVGERMMNLL